MICLGKSIITKVQSLDWLKPETPIKHRMPRAIQNDITDNGMKCEEYDVILGSDIVYERTLILPLCKILKSYLHYGTDKGFKNIAYIACTERSYTTLECFEVILLWWIPIKGGCISLISFHLFICYTFSLYFCFRLHWKKLSLSLRLLEKVCIAQKKIFCVQMHCISQQEFMRLLMSQEQIEI